MPPPSQSTILVTGAHRTGTTWVGKMLAASGQAAYISEPLNVLHRPGVMGAKVERWYTYICQDNEQAYLDALQETVRLRYHLLAELRALRSSKDLLRMGRDLYCFGRGRLLRQRTLLKDPFAVFSAPWFADRLGCQVVVTVRHPAAFASSLKRLNWPFDFGDLLAQPLLMRDRLEPWRKEMEDMLQQPGDMVGQAGLLWKMIYHVMAEQRKTHPAFLVVRHENLSREPVHGYQALYKALGLRYGPRAEKAILRSSSTENPAELRKNATHRIRLDSRANLENWKRRLDKVEIGHLRRLTEETAAMYYPEISWE